MHLLALSNKEKENGKKMKTKIVNFLKYQISVSLEAMIQNLAKKISTAQAIDGALSTMIAASVSVMKAINMEDELRFLGLLITARLGEKGVEVPEAIMKMFASAQPPTEQSIPASVPASLSVPKISALAPAPAPAPAPSKSNSATAPARTLAEPDGPFKSWKGFLKGIVAGKSVKMKSVQELTVKIFAASTKLLQEDWELLFKAMMKAEERNGHIISNGVNPSETFQKAPKALLYDLLFGQEGWVLSLTGIIEKCEGELPAYMCARASVVLDLVLALDSIELIGKHEVKLYENLLIAIEEKNPPRWLMEEGNSFWPSSPENERESPPNHVIADAMAKAGVMVQ